MTRRRLKEQLLTGLVVGLLATSFWQIGEASYIVAKARLAQYLLQRAWTRALAGELTPKPWPWADTWPVARLRLNRLSVDLIVLAGAYGRTLAFGPAHVGSSALPGETGTVMLIGHRDTHFQFLKEVRLDDRVDFTRAEGQTVHYRIREQQVLDSRQDGIPMARDAQEVVFVTCYPFDAVTPGGPLRYVVRAERIN